MEDTPVGSDAAKTATEILQEFTEGFIKRNAFSLTAHDTFIQSPQTQENLQSFEVFSYARFWKTSKGIVPLCENYHFTTIGGFLYALLCSSHIY